MSIQNTKSADIKSLYTAPDRQTAEAQTARGTHIRTYNLWCLHSEEMWLWGGGSTLAVLQCERDKAGLLLYCNIIQV